ncbi:MAG: aminodeoxychorismate/anthranilate synthase component II [Acidaminococcaceae bacterium]|nr:aminodeoxychorismate/anthranilate synthase component II [Acidaminococcaceae bacterium]MBR1589570.1 aminodeoxychorismate/anthranilate synthase component II [Acidaminococcaceae bacterium]
MILLIDNYDSFSYNLYQLVGTFNPDIRVIRNDALSVKQIAEMQPERIILSPGPGYPKDAGVCMEVIEKLGSGIPMLGVCLGHQAICQVFGAVVDHAKQLMHGKQSLITVDPRSRLFSGLPEQIPVARYHSLAAIPETLPECLRVTGATEEGEIMAVEHARFPVYGVQFHPESILTPDGAKIIQNFLAL